MMVGYMLVAKVGNEGLYYEPAPAEVGTLQFFWQPDCSPVFIFASLKGINYRSWTTQTAGVLGTGCFCSKWRAAVQGASLRGDSMSCTVRSKTVALTLAALP